MRVTLDGGSDALTRAAAPGIVPWVREIEQDVFACDSFSLADDDHVALLPTTFDEGSDHSQVTLAGTLAEWSLDAVGWLAAFLADVISRHGVSTPLMFAVDRRPAGSR